MKLVSPTTKGAGVTQNVTVVGGQFEKTGGGKRGERGRE